MTKETNLNPHYTFNSFNTGMLAFSMGKVIAKEFDFYSPVFIYGKKGSGKTYLLNAIGNLFNETHKDKKVLYATAEIFVKDLVNGIRKNNRAEFEEKYRKCDLSIIDDIQYLSEKLYCQEEVIKLIKIYFLKNQKLLLASNLDKCLRCGFSNAFKDECVSSVMLEI